MSEENKELQEIYVTKKKEKKSNKEEEIKDRDLGRYIKSKLYPIPYTNGKGYRIGNYHVMIDKDNLPFSTVDQVDHFLINLFDYVREYPNNKLPIGEFNKKFFKNREENILVYTPIKYIEKIEEEKPTEKTGGVKYKKRKNKNTKMKKSKKNRTRKNR